jgi:hypothetical protein
VAGRASGAAVTSASTSSGRASTTGPGRPSSDTVTARASTSGIRAASSTSAVHLAMVANTRATSSSWKASRPRSERPTWPTSSSMGAESCAASWTPTLALVAPGPRVTRQTPGRPVSLP